MNFNFIFTLGLIFIFINNIYFINGQFPKEYVGLNYTVKSLTLVGTQISLVSGEIEFDENLYVKTSSSCPDFICPQYNFTCPPCDYTHSNPLGCGQVPQGCPPCSNYTDSQYANHPCDTDLYDWEDLTLSQSIHRVTKGDGISRTSYSLYRFYPDSTCQGYKISMNLYSGVGQLFADFFPFQPEYDGIFKSIFSEEIDPGIILCPSLTGFHHATQTYYTEYPYGTIFIAVVNDHILDFEYDLLIEPITVTQTTPIPCTNIDPDFQCIPDGGLINQLALVPQGTLTKYSFTFNTCKDITFVTNYLLNDVDLFVSESSDLSVDNFRWSSTYSLDENLLIYLCPDPGQTSKTIYIGVLAFYQSNYDLFIQTKADIKLVEISKGPLLNGQWRLYTTSYLLNRKSGKELRCDNYDRECFEYFPIYPREELMALYPIPGIFNADGFISPRYKEIYINQSTNPSKQKTYQFGIILSLTIDGVVYSYNQESEIESLELHFLNRIFKSDGTPITGVIPLGGHEITNPCSYEKFKEVINQIDKVVDLLDVVGYNEINSLRYALDLYTYEDRYFTCKAMAESFLNITTITKTLETKMCIPTDNLDDYFDDPCCSIYARYDGCCRAREKNVKYKALANVDESKVEDSCAFSSCAISVLTDFAESLVGNQYDPCKVTSENEDILERNLYETFRKCKLPLYSTVRCETTAYCQNHFNSSLAYCNARSKNCDTPYEIIDKNYLTCILDNILPPLKHEVLSLYKISPTIPSSEQATMLLPNLIDYDCSTQYNFNDEIRYVLKYSMDGYIGSYCYPAPVGLDKSMLQEYSDSCYIGIYNFIWVGLLFTEQHCNEIVRCNWLGTDGSKGIKSYDEMVSSCSNFPPTIVNNAYNFCGDCSDPFENCVSDLTISSKTTCESKYVCYLPDYDQNPPIYVNDPQDCIQNYGSCDVPCGYECGGQACYVPRDANNPVCPFLNNNTIYGYPYDDPSGVLGSYCSYQVGSATCASISGTFVDCSQFTFDQCTICDNTPDVGCLGFGTLCQPKPIECTSQAACEAQGKCSDLIYFENQFGFYPTFKPKCVYSRYYEVSKNSSQPGCQVPYTQDSPLGCIEISDPTLIDEQACIDFGGAQWTRSTTQQECESFSPICSGTENFPSDSYLPYTKRYNEKNEADCACAGQTWDKPFTWTQGVWRPGSPVQLQWIPINQSQPLTPLTTYSKILFHEKLFNAFSNAKFKRTSLLYKSEILCRISNVKDALESLSCSCTTDGGSSCFDIINPPIISVIKPCFETVGEYPILTDGGSLLFSTKSITLGSCVSISIGEVSQYTFISKKIVALSAGFVSYKVPGDYSIYNDKKAVIGEIQSSGILMDFFDNGTNFFEICLKQTIDTNSFYPIKDIGFITDENEGIVEPMECDIIMKGEAYCCNVTRMEKTSKYILIKRIENWEKEPYQPFSKSARNMLYTLAVIFLILAIYGLGNVGFFVFLKLFATEPFKLVHLLFLFLMLFSLIRSIYFFILPGGTVLDQSANVGEYILVVLPNFLYFTAFTIVVVIWYTLTSNSFNSDIYRRMFNLIIVINTILYALFIAIVLVFNFTKQKTPPTCGGRILAEYSNSSPQKVVSILYAVLQSVLSLAIGLAFIYYGRKIYLRLSEIKNIQKQRVLYIGIICSSCFVLHCIFIIILVSANPSNVIFSFIGLIVTEILPVSTLFFFNNQFPWLKLKQKAVKQLSRSSIISSSSHSERTHTERNISMSNKPEFSTEPITKL